MLRVPAMLHVAEDAPLWDNEQSSAFFSGLTGRRTHQRRTDNPESSQPVVEIGSETAMVNATRAAEKIATMTESANAPTDGSKQLQDRVLWLELGLCKALSRAVAHLGFISPTPIQASAIPVALTGVDVCARAVTGSGKTAAFLLPLLHRLLTVRPVRQTALRSQRRFIRSLVLVPSRELAAQCETMARQLTSFTTAVESTVVVGGASAQAQENALAKAPELVIATPGRLCDIIRNYSDKEALRHTESASRSSATVARSTTNIKRGLDVSGIEAVALDECDKLLTITLKDQVIDILDRIVADAETPPQVLLFSATMTKEVDEFATQFLTSKPRSIDVGHVALAAQLKQQFIRITVPEPVDDAVDEKSKTEKRRRQEKHEEDAEPASEVKVHVSEIKTKHLVAVCTEFFRGPGILIFARHRSTVHRVAVLMNELGMPTAELQGDQAQEEREGALKRFENNDVNFLVTTDIASRGLHLNNVSTVINFDLPPTLTAYIHRVGRTARIGRSGVAASLVYEAEDAELMRKILAVSKSTNVHQTASVKRRDIPAESLKEASMKVDDAFPRVREVLAAEALEAQIRDAERKLAKLDGDLVPIAVRRRELQRAKELSNLDNQTLGHGERLTRSKRARARRVEERESALLAHSSAVGSDSLGSIVAPTPKKQWCMSADERRQRLQLSKEMQDREAEVMQAELRQEVAQLDREDQRFRDNRAADKRKVKQRKAVEADREREKRRDARAKQGKKLEAGIVRKQKQARIRKAQKERRVAKRESQGQKAKVKKERKNKSRRTVKRKH